MAGTKYRFRIDAFSPATLPMARLAEYMTDLAVLLGEPEHVHFDGLEEGSAVIVQQIDPVAVPKVQHRLMDVGKGDGPGDAVRAFHSLDRRLANDNAVGSLGSEQGEIIHFPGRERAKPLEYGTFREQGSLDGQLVRIGGKDQTAHGILQDGTQYWNCEMTRAMAREMGQHLFNGVVRVFGEGRWLRDGEGNWSLKRFAVSHFEVLDDAPWPATVARLRKVKGAGWSDTNDPIGELDDLRHGGEEPL